MFLTASDFNDKPYNLPDIENDDSFQAYVDKEEETILRHIVGHELYDELAQAVEYPGGDPKWDDLINGAYYTLSPQTTVKRKWWGIKKMLVPYIYCIWTRDTFDNHGLNGVEIAKIENGTYIGPNDRLKRSYNSFADMVGTFHRYPNYYGRYSQQGKIDTLYGFLVARKDDFPTAVFGKVGRMNELGLRSHE